MNPDRLIEWRKERGLSIKAAAALLGVSRNTWSDYERGRSHIPLLLRWALVGASLARQPYE